MILDGLSVRDTLSEEAGDPANGTSMVAWPLNLL